MKTFLLSIIFLFLSLTAVNAGETEEGKELFQLRCGDMCHQLPEPDMLKPGQWRKILAIMQLRMKQKIIEPLSEEEFETIFNYLKEKAKK